MSSQLVLINEIKGIIQDTTFSSDDILRYLNEGNKKIAGGVLLRYPDGTQVRSSPLPDLSTTGSLTSSTTLAYISVPSDYDRTMYFLTSETSDLRVMILGSLGELLNYYPALDNTNQIRFAAISAKRLYYQGINATAETLTAYYFRKPHDMVRYAAGTISFTALTSTISDSADGLAVFYDGQVIDITGTTSNDGQYTIDEVESDGSSMTLSDATLVNEAVGTTFTIRSRPDGIPEHLHEDLLVNYVTMRIFERKSISDPGKMGDAKRCADFFNQAMLNLEASTERVPEPITMRPGD